MTWPLGTGNERNLYDELMKVTDRRRQFGCTRPSKSGNCGRRRPTAPITTLRTIVQTYRRLHQEDADVEHSYYASLTPELAIKHAGWAKDHRGKRYAHQRRITQRALRAFEAELYARRGAIAACRSFDELLMLVREAVQPVDGAGPLLAYDTALRLGAQAGLRPQRVYLHAGVRVGAANLGLR